MAMVPDERMLKSKCLDHSKRGVDSPCRTLVKPRLEELGSVEGKNEDEQGPPCFLFPGCWPPDKYFHPFCSGMKLDDSFLRNLGASEKIIWIYSEKIK